MSGEGAPRLFATWTAGMELGVEQLRALDVDGIELRLDRFGSLDLDACQALVARAREAAGQGVLLVTCSVDRAAAGEFAGADSERLGLLKAAAKAGADWVDLDARLLGLVLDGQTDGWAGVGFLLSGHPQLDRFSGLEKFASQQQYLLERALNAGLNVVGAKLVPSFPLAEDAAEMLGWLANWAQSIQGRGLLACGFAAGQISAFTRSVAPALGSDFVFAAAGVDRGNPVPGQLTVEALRKTWVGGRVPALGTPIFGVLGQPVAGSLSPELFTWLFEQAGFEGVYTRFDLGDPGSLLGASWLRGLSVTAPHKAAAWYLAGPAGCDVKLGALNTLVFGDAPVAGANTDLDGVRAGVRALLGEDFDARVRDLVVIGAGGAARAVLAALGGAQWRGNATVLARDPRRAMGLAREFGAGFGGLEELEVLAPDLIVHATSARAVDGWVPGAAALADLAERVGGCRVLDANYAPDPSPLVGAARALGLESAGGATWFLAQALAQFERFTGGPFGDLDGARAKLGELLAERAGARPRPWIVLMGLRGAGKSHLGARLAGELGLGFVDLDDELAARAGVDSAGELFGRLGESDFRLDEAGLFEEMLAGEPGVMAVGGGLFTSGAACASFGAAGAFGVWLDADDAELANRAKADQTVRPGLFDDLAPGSVEEMERARRQRAGVFERLGQLRIVNSGAALDEASARLAGSLRASLHLD